MFGIFQHLKIKIVIAGVLSILGASAGGLAFVKTMGWAQSDPTAFIMLFIITIIVMSVISIFIPY